MLQKPKTKFGYAHRILALPVLFTVAFAYLVNAKNREIEETNLSIKKAVSEIKIDTVKEKTEQKEITEPTTKSPGDNERLAELERKLSEKENELSNLSPDSEAFDKKVEEIGTLASEIGGIAASIEVDEYFNSAEWKNQMKELENLNPLDKKELRKIKREAAKAGREAAKAAKEASKIGIEAGRIGREAAEQARIEGEKARKEGELARIAGEQARINGEAARKAGEEARKIGAKARIEAQKIAAEAVGRDFKEINFTKAGTSPNVMVLQADFIKKDGNGNIAMNGVKRYNLNGFDEAKFFVDGRSVSKEEFHSIKPENIASMNVIKENKMKGTESEIRIQTKK